ncbi:MAG: GntR family transcriptional regulator [Pseudomonadota bacterium]
MSLSDVTPIARRPLHEELTERLRSMILDGALAPGEKISEKALCDRFGVSRTPLREALKMLAAEGLVALTPHRGASVTRLTMADLDEAFPVLGALEAVAGELASAHVTEAEIATAQALQSQMRACHEAGDLKGYFACNERIHRLILQAAKNPTLTQMMQALGTRVRRARYQANMSEDRWAQAVAEHEAILEALATRDGVRLGALLKQHLANKAAALREALPPA